MSTVYSQQPESKRRGPDKAQVAMAKFVMKRNREGKGNIEITPRIRKLAAMSIDDVPFDA